MITTEIGYIQAWQNYQLGRRATTFPAEALLRLQYELEQYDRGLFRKGPWFFTATGRRFWFEDPREEDVDIEDIAASLSKQTRFMGHLARNKIYSVAQHSTLASYLVDPGFELEALLHDAAEAYCHDVVTPLKKVLGAVYARIEDRIHGVIRQRYQLSDDEAAHHAVEEVDRRLTVTEARDLSYWGVLARDTQAAPFPVEISPLSPKKARKQFLRRFYQLWAVR
jgi:5'-deoxynucleotidase YfbR-like HD superfamily hydrolase